MKPARGVNKETWTRTRIHRNNLNKATTWCRTTLGPKYNYLDPSYAGWNWETSGSITHFWFRKESDALMFKLSVECLEEKVEAE